MHPTCRLWSGSLLFTALSGYVQMNMVISVCMIRGCFTQLPMHHCLLLLPPIVKGRHTIKRNRKSGWEFFFSVEHYCLSVFLCIWYLPISLANVAIISYDQFRIHVAVLMQKARSTPSIKATPACRRQTACLMSRPFQGICYFFLVIKRIIFVDTLLQNAAQMCYFLPKHDLAL